MGNVSCRYIQPFPMFNMRVALLGVALCLFQLYNLFMTIFLMSGKWFWAGGLKVASHKKTCPDQYLRLNLKSNSYALPDNIKP